MQNMHMTIAYLLIFAYLIGSLSSAIIICKMLGLQDPRTQGSKNAGATNVLRLSNKRIAFAVLLGDMVKGLIPVLIGHLLHVEGAALGYIAVFAVIGHIFPVFFRFRGGKGVATALGCFLGLSFVLGILVIACWLIMLAIYRYSSLASIIAVTLAPILTLAFANPAYLGPLLLIFLIVTLKHKQNISRIIAGNEKKVTFKSRGPEAEQSDDPNDKSNS